MGRARVLRNGVPVVELLAAKLRRQLQDGKARPGELITSEYDLARSEKVNRMVARRAVDVLIAEGKLERRPGKGVYIRSLGTGTADPTPTPVQIAVVNFAGALWAGAARGAKAAALQVGARVQIYDTDAGLAADLEMIRNLPMTSVRGAVIISVHRKRFAEALYGLRAARYPLVLVDETLHDLEIPSVVADNYRGGYLAGQKLIERGHRRIGFLAYLGADTSHARLDGLRDAMADAGVPLDRSLVKGVRDTLGMGTRGEIGSAVRSMLGRPNPPTAVFFGNDAFAAEGCRLIRSLGLHIPDDISAVGFDGGEICRLLVPTLATVRQPIREMGVVAMEMLLALMAGGRKDEGGRRKAKGNGCGDAETRGQGGGPGDPDTRRHGEAPHGPVAGDAPIAAAKETGNQSSAWHRVLPVTWQDGESIGPAPAAAGDFTTKDTKATDSAREDAKNAKRNPAADVEMAGV